MAKFEALNGVKTLVLSFIERDEKGAIVRDQTIPFNIGVISRDYSRPANLITEDEARIKFLRNHKGNEANGGIRFREIVEKQNIKPKAKTEEKSIELPKHAPTAAVVTELPKLEDDFVFPDDLAETPEATEEKALNENTDYPYVTTAQEAGLLLRTLFPELKARDVSPKAKALEVAASKKITFSNLEL